MHSEQRVKCALIHSMLETIDIIESTKTPSKPQFNEDIRLSFEDFAFLGAHKSNGKEKSAAKQMEMLAKVSLIKMFDKFFNTHDKEYLA